jgi:tRNA-dihydrouridine synthase 4
LIKQDLQIPVIANGGIFTLKGAEELYQLTKVDGVMSARGLLRNPTLFAKDDDNNKGYSSWECIEKFCRLSLEYGTNHFIFHHHL